MYSFNNIHSMYRLMQESKCYSRPCEYCSDQDQYFSYSHKSPYCCCFVISQARILEWVAISFSRGFQPRDWTPRLLHWARRLFTTQPSGKPTDTHAILHSEYCDDSTRTTLTLTVFWFRRKDRFWYRLLQ